MTTQDSYCTFIALGDTNGEAVQVITLATHVETRVSFLALDQDDHQCLAIINYTKYIKQHRYKPANILG